MCPTQNNASPSACPRSRFGAGPWPASLRSSTIRATYPPALRDEVTLFEQTKGSPHFAIDKPLPKRLVKKLITTRTRQLGLK